MAAALRPNQPAIAMLSLSSVFCYVYTINNSNKDVHIGLGLHVCVSNCLNYTASIQGRAIEGPIHFMSLWTQILGGLSPLGPTNSAPMSEASWFWLWNISCYHCWYDNDGGTQYLKKTASYCLLSVTVEPLWTLISEQMLGRYWVWSM